MHYETRTPDKGLEDLVNRYCIMRYSKTTIREIPPSTNIWAYFHISNQSYYKTMKFNSKEIIPTDTAEFIEMTMQNAVLLRNVVIGPHRNMIIENTKGEALIFGIEFKTNGYDTFGGIPISKTANKIMDINQFEESLQNIASAICETPIEIYLEK